MKLVLLTGLMIGLFVSVVLLIGNQCEEANAASDYFNRRLESLPGTEGLLASGLT